ncbi:MAG: Holliday junction DNA helicase RuvA [Epulopiscium sp. Nuni2H_MBin003]|nr:MAG: Holliday junction DNA helicase RuvA [Epulopiscium sp. Nuni2H_MBin003]
MIAYLVGNITDRYDNYIVLEVNGVGYEIFMCTDYADPKKIYIYENIKEDAYDLYGFLYPADKRLFKKLLSVSGIGPKAAAALISMYGQQLVEIIIKQDANSITKISGIGNKTANRLILELKDRLDSVVSYDDAQPVATEEAVLALVSLGYNEKQAKQAVNAIFAYNDTAEHIIKKALKLLSE